MGEKKSGKRVSEEMVVEIGLDEEVPGVVYLHRGRTPSLNKLFKHPVSRNISSLILDFR